MSMIQPFQFWVSIIGNYYIFVPQDFHKNTELVKDLRTIKYINNLLHSCNGIFPEKLTNYIYIHNYLVQALNKEKEYIYHKNTG